MRLRTKVFCVSLLENAWAFLVVGCCNNDKIEMEIIFLKLASVINLFLYEENVTRKYGPLSKWNGNWITGHYTNSPLSDLRYLFFIQFFSSCYRFTLWLWWLLFRTFCWTIYWFFMRILFTSHPHILSMVTATNDIYQKHERQSLIYW